MECKYSIVWGGWCSKEDRGGYGICLWKYIHSGWNYFARFVSFSVGKGTNVCFWLDWLCGDGVLKDAFPTLFSFAYDKGATMVD